MSRPPRVVTSLRVPPDLWAKAKAKADERQEVLSEELIKFLVRYVEKK